MNAKGSLYHFVFLRRWILIFCLNFLQYIAEDFKDKEYFSAL